MFLIGGVKERYDLALRIAIGYVVFVVAVNLLNIRFSPPTVGVVGGLAITGVVLYVISVAKKAKSKRSRRGVTNGKRKGR